MMYDVLIVGGGITGCMTAYKLAKYDLKVGILEGKSDVAMGATKANSAIVHAGFDAQPGTLKATLNVLGCAEMPAIAKELDVPYRNNTSLVLAFDEGQKKALEGLKQRGEANGVPQLSIIDAAELQAIEPNVAPNAVAALRAGSAGIVCPYELCIAAAENAVLNGNDVILNSPVTEIVRQGDHFEVTAGGRNYRARYLINAAGVHADGIAAIAGEKDFPLTIIPRRGEYMLLDKEQGGMTDATLFTLPTEKGKGVLVSPTVDGNLLVGPNAYAIDDADDTSTTAEGLEEIGMGVKQMVPNVNLRAVITSFAGVRPTPSTGDFYIKPSEQIIGLLHLAGIESPGLASSPAVAEMAVKLLGNMGLALKERENYLSGRPTPIRFRELSDEDKAAIIEKDRCYAKIICRCEQITEGEIVAAIRRPIPATDIDMVKRRTRAGMGRCQGGFCSPRVTEIIARERKLALTDITKKGEGSALLTDKRA